MKTYNGELETKFWWLIPLLFGVSKSTITKKTYLAEWEITNRNYVYALHITPFIEIGIEL